jgi:hypothetical protein
MGLLTRTRQDAMSLVNKKWPRRHIIAAIRVLGSLRSRCMKMVKGWPRRPVVVASVD